MNEAHIDIFSDPVCPWSLVGLAQLDRALARLEGAQITIKYHPFLLDADTPKEGEDVVAMLKRKYGKAPDEMFDRLEQEAKSCGLDLNMRTQKMRYPSQKSHVLIMAASNKEDSTNPHVQHSLACAISRACYLDGLNIAEDTVLMEIGLAHGFEAQEISDLVNNEQAISEVEKSARRGPEAGITSVPCFIFNNKFALSGAQPLAIFEEALDRALSKERAPGNPE